MKLKEHLRTSRSTGKLSWTRAKGLLIALSLTLSLAVSGCQSKQQTVSFAARSVVVDQSLMAESQFEMRMLDFLSEKPSEQTSPSPLSKE